MISRAKIHDIDPFLNRPVIELNPFPRAQPADVWFYDDATCIDLAKQIAVDGGVCAKKVVPRLKWALEPARNYDEKQHR